jgi:hypothetical protein
MGEPTKKTGNVRSLTEAPAVSVISIGGKPMPALPEGPDKIEMSLKVRSLEHAIEFRASIPVSAQRVKGIR